MASIQLKSDKRLLNIHAITLIWANQIGVLSATSGRQLQMIQTKKCGYRQSERWAKKTRISWIVLCGINSSRHSWYVVWLESHGSFLVIAQIAPHNMIYGNDECLCHICNQIISLGSHPVKWIMHTVDTRRFQHNIRTDCTTCWNVSHEYLHHFGNWY